MAENEGQSVLESTTPEQVLAAGGVSKRRRNLSNKSGDRLRNPHSKSPKRRAGTPEPERRIYTDDSEKDVSDTDNIKKSPLASRGEDEKKKQTPGRSRVLVRPKEYVEAVRRTRSAERPPKKDMTTEIDDFEVIRRLHKSKELEEELSEKRRQEILKPKVKEELKEFVPKEMPPLIMAPTELRKRIRPKTLALQKSLSEDERPKTEPRTKSKTRFAHRKVSTSEEEEESASALAVKGKLTLKPKSTQKEEVIKAEPRKKRLVAAKKVVPKERVKKGERKPKPDVSESEDAGTEKVEEPEEPEEEEEEEEGEPEEEEPKPELSPAPSKPWFFQRWFGWNKKPVKPQEDEEERIKEEEPEEKGPIEEEKLEAETEETVEEAPQEEEKEEESVKEPEPEPVEVPTRKRWLITEVYSEWRSYANEHADEYDRIMCLKNRCMSSLLLVLIYCGFGGMIFRFTEGAFESFYKCGVKRVKRDFIDTLWSNSQYMREDDWKSQARRKLMEFENQLHTAHEAGMTTYSGQRSWSFLNAVVYCITVVTTIGYGHISPSTATGRAITIVYAIFGIPMFLILLADFGKLFTRGIKFLWAFVRRLYYTGSCKKVRKTVPVQEVMKGVQLVYDFAKNRRPSQMPPEGGEGEAQQERLKPPDPEAQGNQDTPGTPALSTFEVDDEFNLPISVAIVILLIYIFVGATIYWMWEEWSFFESFYFVFISMSTIGFGDFVPQHPMYMMASIVYLVFGLALTSMCINVVQEKLSDTFKQASIKIGSTIGLRVATEDDGTGIASAPAELADVKLDQKFEEK